MLHPILGRSFAGPGDTCSKCGGTIPEDHVPLILMGSGKNGVTWVYCEECEGGVMADLKKHMKSKVVGAEK